MAKSTVIKLEEFDLVKALNGATLARSGDGSMENKTLIYAEKFGLSEIPVSGYKYHAWIQGEKTYYNSLGNCSTGNTKDRLFIVTATEKTSIDNVATKGEAEGTTSSIKINSLNPREEFAKAAMTSLLDKIDDPLNVDTVTIVRLAETSFKIAQSMLNTAADYRSVFKEDTSQPTTTIPVQATDVSSTTDKILFNLAEQIKKYNETVTKIKDEILTPNRDNVKTIKEEIVTIDDSVKTIATASGAVQKVDVASVSMGAIPASVGNTVNTTVTNSAENPVNVKPIA